MNTRLLLLSITLCMSLSAAAVDYAFTEGDSHLVEAESRTSIMSFPVDSSEAVCESEECWVTGFGPLNRSLWLPNLPDGVDHRFEFDENGGFFETFNDGRVHIYGQCNNIFDEGYGFYVDFWFKEKKNWEEWSALGRGWKGNPNIVGDLYETWDYYIMDDQEENVLIGTEGFEGSILYCTHKPADYYYGLQVGLAANDQNAEPGMSCWFFYSGQINGDPVDGNGDINLEGECVDLAAIECVTDVELDCIDADYSPEAIGFPEVVCDSYTLEYEDAVLESGCPTIILRTWTATHTNGDTATCEQTITLNDELAPVITVSTSLLASCEADYESLFDVSDDCDPTPEVSFEVIDSAWVEGDDCTLGQLRTQTMGGWGTNPNGNNPGVYLDENFDAVFPNGLTIGCTNTLTLTSAQAVRDFLPSGSTPAALPEGEMADPGDTYNNVLAGQLVAATLSTTFDSYDSDFGFSEEYLGDGFIQSGPYEGLTVSELVNLANQVIGGCNNEVEFSALNDALSSINQNYVDGTQDNGFLGCEFDFDCALGITVQVTATDDCGNQSQAENTFYWEDNQAPVIIEAPENITVECGEVPEPNILVEDDCSSAEVSVVVNDESFSGACLPTIQRTYTVTDHCGNTTEHIQYITVIDTNPPVFTNPPADIVMSCGEEVPFFDPQAEDECGEIVVELVEDTEVLDCGFVTTQTWVAADLCGNNASVTRQIFQVDNEGPVPTTEVVDLTVSCDALLEEGNVSFEDACGEVVGVNVSEEQIGGGCEYVLARTYEAMDNCGNLTVVHQTITVVDNEAPVANVSPANVAIQCGEDIPAFNPSFSDNCSGVEVVFTEEWLEEGEACGVLFQQWTATDACGNSTSIERTITLVDAEGPVFTGVPTSGDAACADFGEAPLVTSEDACDGPTPVNLTEDIQVLDCEIILTRTWTATDLCGNESIAEQTLSFIDTEAPAIIGEDVLQIECSDLEDNLVQVEDDCSFAVELAFSDVTLETDASGCNLSIERTWTATDACGNEAVFVQLLQISDQTPPIIEGIPSELEVACGEEAPLVDPNVYDLCSNAELTLSVEQTGIGCDAQEVRTWTAVDGCGNASTFTQVVSFLDTEAPVFADVPNDIELDCGDIIPEPANVTANDNCSNVEISFEETIEFFECESNYEITRIWTATDVCGNTSNAVQVITVTDTEAPVFDFVPEDITASCGTIPDPVMLTASDNCSEVIVEFEEEADAGGCPNIFRTWTATDACGNATTFVQTIFIEDNEPPVLIGIPENTQVTCDNIPPMPEPEVSDNCDENVAITANENIVGVGCEFTIIRTWIASDDCGNTTIVSQSITVTDNSAPVFVDAPVSLTVECSQLEGVPYPQVQDDCGANLTLEFSDEVLEEGCEKLIERTYTATDACGNSAEAVTLITVLDQSPPMIVGVGPNQFVECDAIPEPQMAMATDLCSDQVTLEVTENIISQDDCGFILDRTYIAVDGCGNTSALTQLIYVNDNTAPEFVGIPEDITLSCGDEFPEAPVVNAIDNCSEEVEVTFASFTEFTDCGEIQTWIWTAADNCGNQNTVSRTVSRVDETGPVFVGVPEDELVNCGEVPEIVMPAAIDDCSAEVEVTVFEEIILVGCPFEIRRTFIATDACGNDSYATQSIFVQDNDAPVFVDFPEDLSISCEDLPEAIAPSTEDACGEVELLLEEEWSEPGCVQTLARIWTALDNCGNITQRTQIITLTDTSAPQLIGTVENVVTNCLNVPEVPSVMAVDDCSGVTLELDEVITETECATEYSIVRMWTATDACGQSASLMQEVQVVDNIAPILMNVPEDVTVTCDEIPEVPEVTAMESCGEIVDVVFEEEITVMSEENGCLATNAEAFNSEIALWLPDVFGLGSDYVFSENGGTLEVNEATGTAVLTGEVFNTLHSEFSWMIHIELGEARNWEDWSALGRDYKDDLGLGEEFYQDWTYFILNGSNSILTGTGELEGSYLNLTHAPADSLYGFQLGMNANNRSEGEGMGGWFFYDGIVNGNYETGHGDVFLELDCCPEQEIVRTWTATDCAGNTSTYTQVITVTNEEVNLLIANNEVEESILDVTNSAGEEFLISLEPSFTGYGELRMTTISGGETMVIMQQRVLEGAHYQIRVPKEGLTPGMYIFTFSGNHQRVSDQEMVLH